MRRRAKKEEAKLNITSLLDMFTIMLLFLLVNFSPTDDKAKLHPDVDLPASAAELDAVNAIDVVLTKYELLLEDKVILKLNKGRFPKRYLDGDKIEPFYKALVNIKKKNEQLMKTSKKSAKRSNGKDNKEERKDLILFQADKTIAFNMIDKVMMTTAQAGFENFKFAVLKKEKN